MRKRVTGVAAGLLVAVLGAGLAVRPFRSLSVLVWLVAGAALAMGVARLWSAAESPSPALGRLLGAVWIAVGIVVLAFPDPTIRVIALAVAISLVATGVVEVLEGLSGSIDQRLAAVIGGVASVIFGLLALIWPDITILVIAVVFGIRTLAFGLGLAWRSLRSAEGAGPLPADGGRRTGFARSAHSAGAVVSLVFALLLGATSAKLRAGEPTVDAFYTAPADVPDEPGRLLSSEPFDREVPDGADAWRILYTTTRDEGEPAVASAIVVVPALRTDPQPVIAWSHGTTGIARRCAPSVLPDPFESGALFALDDVLDQGWALVATDYVGLGTVGPHPYLIGQGEGRSVLDAVRAARELPEADMADETVVWGHSQGGHAALWAAQLAGDYAPELDIRGVAALAPASNLTGFIDNLRDVSVGSLFAAYVLNAYAANYPDVSVGAYARPGGAPFIEGIGERCLNEPAVLASAATSVAAGFSVFKGDIVAGALGERLEENIPRGGIDLPVFVGQGGADPLVGPDAQADYVESRCADGQPIDYRVYEGLGHVSLVEADSPAMVELVEWTSARFAGDPPTPTCGT